MCFKTPLCAGSSSFWLHKLIAHHGSRRTIPVHGGPEGTPGLCSPLSSTSRHLPWFRCWSPLCLSVRSSHKSIIRCYLVPNGHEMVTKLDVSSAKLKPIDFSLKGLVSPFPITWSLLTWFKTREVIHCGGCSVLSWGSKREPARFQSLGVFPPCPVWFLVSLANSSPCQKMVFLPPCCKWGQASLQAVSFLLWQIFYHESWGKWHVVTWTSVLFSTVTTSATGSFAALWWVPMSVAISACAGLHEYLLKYKGNLRLHVRD